jgi:hypothetical protein
MMRMERCGSNVKTQEGKIMTKFNITRYKGRVIYTKIVDSDTKEIIEASEGRKKYD